jgi:hypothetical protein
MFQLVSISVPMSISDRSTSLATEVVSKLCALAMVRETTRYSIRNTNVVVQCLNGRGPTRNSIFLIHSMPSCAS